MSTTPNLLLSHIAASQNQKEVTANADYDGLDTALCSYTSIAMTDADYTFATGAGSLGLSNMVFIFTGALTANRNVILPPNAKPYIVVNATTGGHSLTFKLGTASHTVVISDSVHHLLHSDGVNSVYNIDGSSTADIPVRTDGIGTFVSGTYSASQVLFSIPVAFAYTFAALLAGSEGYCITVPTANATFSIRKNGVEFAQMIFDASSPVTHYAIFTDDASPAASISFNVGDVLSVVAPASPDATIAGVGFQLVATRPY